MFMKAVATLIAVLSTAPTVLSSPNNECDLLSSKYFQWIDSDGSLVRPAFIPIDQVTPNKNNDTVCNEQWYPLPDSRHCRFCRSTRALVCEGSSVYNIPAANTLPTTNLSLFKISGVGLKALQSQSFVNLTIGRLVIHNSNLSSLAADTFTGVRSIKSLYVTYNTLDYVSGAESLFQGIQDLSEVVLKANGLRVLSSEKSAHLQSLTFFSLADNPIHSLSVEFLKNSKLQFLDMRNVLFKLQPSDIKKSGFSSLPKSLTTVDLNGAIINGTIMANFLESLSKNNITVLNLGNLKTHTNVFPALHHVKTSLKFLTLQGTPLTNYFPPSKDEEEVFLSHPFVSLKELNLAKCGITGLGDGRAFKAFPNLTILSLSGNNFKSLDLNLFSFLSSLNFLDFSVNTIYSISNRTDYVSLALQALDLSFTGIYLQQDNLNLMFSLMPNLKYLLLCNAGLTSKHIKAMEIIANLKLLDLSGTVPSQDIYQSLNQLFASSAWSISELHFTRNNFGSFNNSILMFNSIKTLKVLNLSKNLIRFITPGMFNANLEELQLSQNLITTWYSPVLSPEHGMKYLDLSGNQLSYISDAMMADFYMLNFLNLDDNPVMCDSRVIEAVCEPFVNQTHTSNSTWQQNQCYDSVSDLYRDFKRSKDCMQYFAEVATTEENLSTSTTPHEETSTSLDFTWLFIIIVLFLLATTIGYVVYLKWWTIRYYVHRYFSLKKVWMMQKSDEALTRPDIQYDVFVSYSDVDRSWVLDHLIPSLEADGEISLCFHERDFQVGLSILENIIECMDRSNSLLLIVSSAFVRSKWCQFEMHLAQYRLIETIRNQLVLVLLEDIPQKTRPKTLHHMMMTKTYLIWPQEQSKEDARDLFWKRLKRALKPSHGYIFGAQI